jgi:hypothetical protein
MNLEYLVGWPTWYGNRVPSRLADQVSEMKSEVRPGSERMGFTRFLAGTLQPHRSCADRKLEG